MSDKVGMPVKQEVFLEGGVHIGTKIRTSDMREFIFKRRDDGLYILDLRKSAEKLMQAAKVIAKYKPEEVTVVASRVYSSNPATRFAELSGVNLIKGRFVPGTMTNMNVRGFMEPRLMLVCDPKGEHEALVESAKNGVPVIGLCDTDNETKFIDLIVPINNKGKRSLALIFYILTREVMMAQGKIKAYDEFTHDISFFEQQVLEEEKAGKAPAETVEEAVQPQPEPAAQAPAGQEAPAVEEKKGEAPAEKHKKTKKGEEGAEAGKEIEEEKKSVGAGESGKEEKGE
jgi:small subunit ribosomal protein S2